MAKRFITIHNINSGEELLINIRGIKSIEPCMYEHESDKNLRYRIKYILSDMDGFTGEYYEYEEIEEYLNSKKEMYTRFEYLKKLLT